MKTANDILFSVFSDRTLRMSADIPLPASDAEIQAHLAGAVIEGVAPSLAEFRAAEITHASVLVTEAAALLRAEAKIMRAAAVAAITVTTTSGKVFDGDETSQTRMARAIIGLQAAGVPTITWTLTNNSIVDVTVAELTEAMVLAGQAQSAVWTIA